MNCRICVRKIPEVTFSLGEQPVSNSYLSPDAKDEKKYPLDLYYCDICKSIQIDEVVSADEIFADDYPYASSCSSTWLDHCSEYVDYVIDRFGLDKSKPIMEIASNDGCLLKNFVDKGYTVKGVEPAAGVADIAIANGVDTDNVFCNTDYVKGYLEVNEMPQLIIANNVIAHNPRVLDFVLSIGSLLGKGGIFTVEFPHLYNLVRLKQFDTIYHEHYSYFSLYSMRVLLEKCGLSIFDVQELPTHGGSLRVFAQHSHEAKHTINFKVIQDIIDKERELGLYKQDAYKEFSENIKKIKNDFLAFLAKAKEEGKRVVAYGAPAKGNTFLNYCGVTSDDIEYTVDRSSFKVGKLLPGSRIPICDVEKILNDSPDYVVILPWNIKKEVMGILKDIGTKFVTAIPELEII